MTHEYDYIARALSKTQRMYLVEHYEGGKRLIDDRQPNESRTRQSLVAMKLIVCRPVITSRPRWTQLTKRGHEVMCASLGMMADMLTRFNFGRERVAYGKMFNPKPTDPLDDKTFEVKLTIQPQEKTNDVFEKTPMAAGPGSRIGR